jgi:hypothetical protein
MRIGGILMKPINDNAGIPHPYEHQPITSPHLNRTSKPFQKPTKAVENNTKSEENMR